MSTKRTTKNVTTSVKTIGDHLGELRWRIAVVALVFIVLSSLAYTIRDWLVHIVLSPIGEQKLVYLTPAGGFSFIFSVTIYAGVLATAPFFIYHLYKFIAPALPLHVRKYSLKIVAASTVLMVAGVCFGYFVAIPAALAFLTHFAGGFVQPNLTADSYLSFVVAYVLGLGLLFQLPLLLVFGNWIRPFKKGELLNSQRFVLVGAFVAAALITPTPDVLNQTMIALPIVFIYQLGVITVFVANRRASRRIQTTKSRHMGVRPSEVERPSQREVPPVRTVKTAGSSPMKQQALPTPAVRLRHRPAQMSDIIAPVVSRPAMQTHTAHAPRSRSSTARPLSGSTRAGVDFISTGRPARHARQLPVLGSGTSRALSL